MRWILSSVPAARLLRPPIAGLGLGGITAGVAALVTRSTAVAISVYLIIWLFSLWPWSRTLHSVVKSAAVSDIGRIHEQLRIGLFAWAIAGLYGLIVEFFVLIIVSAPLDVAVPVAEVTVLGGTVAYLGLSARFTASAFTADMNRLVNETRASSTALGNGFLESTKNLGKAFETNTERLLQKLDDRGEEQAHILVGMTDALNEVASLLKAQQKVTEETRKLGEDALRLQREAEDARRRLEADRAEAQRQQEEEARRRMMPQLAIRLRASSADVFHHHIFVDIFNRGMTGQALGVSLSTNEGPPRTLLGGTVMAQGMATLDFGDVSLFPLQAIFRVVAVIADTAARRYTFEGQFRYARTTGFWNQTKSLWVEPADFIWSDPYD